MSAESRSAPSLSSIWEGPPATATAPSPAGSVPRTTTGACRLAAAAEVDHEPLDERFPRLGRSGQGPALPVRGHAGFGHRAHGVVRRGPGGTIDPVQLPPEVVDLGARVLGGDLHDGPTGGVRGELPHE